VPFQPESVCPQLDWDPRGRRPKLELALLLALLAPGWIPRRPRAETQAPEASQPQPILRVNSRPGTHTTHGG